MISSRYDKHKKSSRSSHEKKHSREHRHKHRSRDRIERYPRHHTESHSNRHHTIETYDKYASRDIDKRLAILHLHFQSHFMFNWHVLLSIVFKIKLVYVIQQWEFIIIT